METYLLRAACPAGTKTLYVHPFFDDFRWIQKEINDFYCCFYLFELAFYSLHVHLQALVSGE